MPWCSPCVSPLVTTAGATFPCLALPQAHWPLPRDLWGVSFHKIVYTRFLSQMLPNYYTGEGSVGRSAGAAWRLCSDSVAGTQRHTA